LAEALGFDSPTSEMFVNHPLTAVDTDGASQVWLKLVQRPAERARFYGDADYGRWKVNWVLAYRPKG